jgi:hypothetical protein
MIDGKMTAHEMEREHGRELARLRETAEQALEETAEAAATINEPAVESDLKS